MHRPADVTKAASVLLISLLALAAARSASADVAAFGAGGFQLRIQITVVAPPPIVFIAPIAQWPTVVDRVVSEQVQRLKQYVESA